MYLTTCIEGVISHYSALNQYQALLSAKLDRSRLAFKATTDSKQWWTTMSTLVLWYKEGQLVIDSSNFAYCAQLCFQGIPQLEGQTVRLRDKRTLAPQYLRLMDTGLVLGVCTA
ncbi:uncharacterized protein BJ212DRAFT_1295296 [Suillus subaureus]|uniref:Uncharacterized protein n=1 Tax=Suillus subaureus TaxID=48587 RepID=A0A9P7JJL5_9AGAM|nr:uncharacterized protein BJ212DRAFT_1295296 [Suillus subaureus]KAG1826001.1 hypothetical protein BJ212DRAFT_1295296 [Suillus subaureus]